MMALHNWLLFVLTIWISYGVVEGGVDDACLMLYCGRQWI